MFLDEGRKFSKGRDEMYYHHGTSIRRLLDAGMELIPESTEAKLSKALIEIETLKKKASMLERKHEDWKAKYEAKIEMDGRVLSGVRQLLRPNHMRLARDMHSIAQTQSDAAWGSTEKFWEKYWGRLVYLAEHLGLSTRAREFKSLEIELTDAKERGSREAQKEAEKKLDVVKKGLLQGLEEVVDAADDDEVGWAHVYSDLVVECGLDGKSNEVCWRGGKTKAGDFAVNACGCCHVGRYNWSSCPCLACVSDLLTDPYKGINGGKRSPTPYRLSKPFQERRFDGAELAPANAVDQVLDTMDRQHRFFEPFEKCPHNQKRRECEECRPKYRCVFAEQIKEDRELLNLHCNIVWSLCPGMRQDIQLAWAKAGEQAHVVGLRQDEEMERLFAFLNEDQYRLAEFDELSTSELDTVDESNDCKVHMWDPALCWCFEHDKPRRSCAECTERDRAREAEGQETDTEKKLARGHHCDCAHGISLASAIACPNQSSILDMLC